MLEKILENYEDEELLKADGLDEAVIGIATDFFPEPRLIYSVKKCIEIMVKGNDYYEPMEYEDAMEYFTFNVSGGYVGERTPIWCWDDFE